MYLPWLIQKSAGQSCAFQIMVCCRALWVKKKAAFDDFCDVKTPTMTGIILPVETGSQKNHKIPADLTINLVGASFGTPLSS